MFKKRKQVYGLSNKEVLTLDPNFNEIMKNACSEMGLGALHLKSGKEYYGPMDIEGWIGNDRRYYLLDVSR